MNRQSILFLDFDGVLNSEPYLQSLARDADEGWPCDESKAIDPSSIAIVNRIISETGADVVISSAWRYGHDVDWLRRVLASRGFVGNVVDRTPVSLMDSDGTIYSATDRGHEIQAWLDANTDSNAKICILDDNSDMAHLKGFLVQTSFDTGITDADADRAISMLNVG